MSDQLEALNIQPVLVVFDPLPQARAYADETGLDWPILVDVERVLYRKYGMDHASFADLWGPRIWWAYLVEFARGQRPRRWGSDVSQRGGDLLIDPEGVVRLHHVGADPADRPDPKTLLAIVRSSDRERASR